VELRDRLDDVAANGAPAQAKHARELLNRFHDNTADADTEQQARELIDAYLHDPYLTRYE
jgi:hypothetical protein